MIRMRETRLTVCCLVWEDLPPVLRHTSPVICGACWSSGAGNDHHAHAHAHAHPLINGTVLFKIKTLFFSLKSTALISMCRVPLTIQVQSALETKITGARR